MKSFALQHISGVLGQVAAALPLLLMAAFLSHALGLEAAGHFTVMAGVSAATYAAALWGFRTSILLDRFERFSAWDYAVARLLAVSIATIITFLVGLDIGIAGLLILSIVLFRVTDAMIDLGFACNQVWRGTASSINIYALQHMVKLAGLSIVGVVTLIFMQNYVLIAFFICAALAVVGASWMLLRSLRERSGAFISPPMSRIFHVFKQAWWFAAAAAVCAFLTSAPRISLKWLYAGDVLGVIGVSLSVSTLFGMVFYTSWIRALPRLGKRKGRARAVLHYLLENLGLALVMIAVSWLILPPIVGIIFGFSGPVYVRQAQHILTASVIFASGMNLANLYKITAAPWMETVTYLMPLAVVGGMALIWPGLRDTSFMLWAAGLTMMVVSLAAFGLLKKMSLGEMQHDQSR